MKRLFLSLACLGFASVVYSAPIEFVGTIVADTTLNVPSDFATIQDALSYLSDKSIADEVNVTIQVADGTYSDYALVEVTHKDSDKIKLIGNTTNCNLCVLNFAAGQGGIYIRGRRLGYLDGFKLVGTDTVGTHGIYARDNGAIYCGPNICVESFDSGFWAEHSSSLRVNGCRASSCVIGFLSSYCSSMYAQSCKSWSNSKGYFASSGATINGSNSSSSNNIVGYIAWGSSSMNLEGAIARNNSSVGFQASLGSSIGLSSNSISSGNTSYGIFASRGSIVYAASATITNNAVNYSPSLGTTGNQNSLITN